MKKSGNTKSEKKLVYGAIITFLLAVAVFSSIKLTKVDAMNGKEYAKYKYEVMKNNKLSDDKITSGKKLIIAYYSYEKK